MFEIPWSIWGPDYAASTNSSIGRIRAFTENKHRPHKSTFTLAFDAKDKAKPEYIYWEHLLGETPWHGIILKALLDVKAALPQAGLPLGGQAFIDRTPQKARQNPLPKPFRVFYRSELANSTRTWIGKADPTARVPSIENDQSFLFLLCACAARGSRLTGCTYM